jgi:hypothetical protein
VRMLRCHNPGCGKAVRVIGDLLTAACEAQVSGGDEAAALREPQGDSVNAVISEWSTCCGTDLALCDSCLAEVVAAEEQLRVLPCRPHLLNTSLVFIWQREHRSCNSPVEPLTLWVDLAFPSLTASCGCCASKSKRTQRSWPW